MYVGERISKTTTCRLLLPAGAVPSLPHFQQSAAAAAALLISQKPPFVWVLPPCVHSNCKAARQGLFHALPCL